MLVHFTKLLRYIGGRSGKEKNLSDSGQVARYVERVTITIAYKEIVEGQNFFIIQI